MSIIEVLNCIIKKVYIVLVGYNVVMFDVFIFFWNGGYNFVVEFSFVNIRCVDIFFLFKLLIKDKYLFL